MKEEIGMGVPYSYGENKKGRTTTAKASFAAWHSPGDEIAPNEMPCSNANTVNRKAVVQERQREPEPPRLATSTARASICYTWWLKRTSSKHDCNTKRVQLTCNKTKQNRTKQSHPYQIESAL